MLSLLFGFENQIALRFGIFVTWESLVPDLAVVALPAVWLGLFSLLFGSVCLACCVARVVQPAVRVGRPNRGAIWPFIQRGNPW